MKSTSQYTEANVGSDAIRSEIENTRQSMDETLDQIGNRIKPRHLFDDFLDMFRSRGSAGSGKMKEKAGAAMHSAGNAAGRAGHALLETVREHPIPTMLIGAGVAMAVYEMRHAGDHRAEDYDSTHLGPAGTIEEQSGWDEGESSMGFKEKAQHGIESAKEGAQSLKQKVQGKAAAATEQMRSRLSEGRRAMGERAGQLKERLRGGAQRTYTRSRERFAQTTEEHPMSVGVGFLALGLLVGLAIPCSRKENEWMGETSDRLKSTAKSRGQEMLEKGKHVASAAAESARKSAAEQGLTIEGMRDKARQVASESKQAAMQTAEAEGLKKPSGSTTQPV